jgi:hypothetical protein
VGEGGFQKGSASPPGTGGSPDLETPVADLQVSGEGVVDRVGRLQREA